MSISIIKELISKNIAAGRMSAVKAGSKLFIEAALGDHNLLGTLSVAESVALVACASDPTTYRGEVLRELAVGTLAVAGDQIVEVYRRDVAEKIQIDPQTTAKMVLETKHEELNDDTRFSPDAPVHSNPAPEGSMKTEPKVEEPKADEVKTVTPDAGADLGNTIAAAMANGKKDKDDKKKGDKVDCPRCKQECKVKKMSPFKFAKENILGATEGAWEGTPLCGSCRTKINDLNNQAHRDVRELNGIADELSAVTTNIAELDAQIIQKDDAIKNLEPIAATNEDLKATLDNLRTSRDSIAELRFKADEKRTVLQTRLDKATTPASAQSDKGNAIKA